MASIPQEQYVEIQYAGQEIDPLASKLSVLERRFDAHIGKGGNVHASVNETEAGFMTPQDKNKLDGVQAGATQNSPDEFLLNRGNQTGLMPIEGVSGLRQELDDALAGGSNYRGLFPSLAALEEAIPVAVAGNYADVDEGEDIDAVRYIWDESDQQWVSAGPGESLTAPQVKALYESNPNTNALTDTRLSMIFSSLLVVKSLSELRGITERNSAILGEVIYLVDDLDQEAEESFPQVVIGDDSRRWKWIEPSCINAKFFMDPDLSINESLQMSIDYCLSFSPPKSLFVSEIYEINSTLMVDQPVEATSGEFHVVGLNGGGFSVSSAVTMFSSRLPYLDFNGKSAPPSEYLHFKSVRFDASTPNLDAYVISDKFLRLTCTDCNFRRIKFLKEADFLQSIAFLGKCQSRLHAGIFMKFTDSYDLDLTGLNFEISGAAFVSDGLSNVVRLSGLYEGSTGPFWSGSGNVINLHNIYFEKNGSPEIVIPGGDAIVLESILFALDAEQANPSNDYWPVVLGADCKGVSAEGCISTGGIFNNSAMPPFSLSWNNCRASTRILRKNTSANLNLYAAGNDQASAEIITTRSSVITGGEGGVRLPSVLISPDLSELILLNSSGSQKLVYPAQGQRFVGAGYDQPISIPSGGSLRFSSSQDDSWILW